MKRLSICSSLLALLVSCALASAPGDDYSDDSISNMVGGYTVIAFPAVCQDTGIMSFLVGGNGTICEADLGPETLATALVVETFDPRDGRSAVKPTLPRN